MALRHLMDIRPRPADDEGDGPTYDPNAGWWTAPSPQSKEPKDKKGELH